MCVQCVHDLSAMLATTYWNKVIYIYIYIYIQCCIGPVHIYTHIYARMYVCMYVCTYVRTYVRTYVCMYVCKKMYVLLQTLKIDHVQFFSMFHFQN